MRALTVQDCQAITYLSRILPSFQPYWLATNYNLRKKGASAGHEMQWPEKKNNYEGLYFQTTCLFSVSVVLCSVDILCIYLCYLKLALLKPPDTSF